MDTIMTPAHMLGSLFGIGGVGYGAQTIDGYDDYLNGHQGGYYRGECELVLILLECFLIVIWYTVYILRLLFPFSNKYFFQQTSTCEKRGVSSGNDECRSGL